MNIFVFGNSIVAEDSKPVELLFHLQDHFPTMTFIHADPTDEWWEGQNNPIILDTVVGLKQVTLFSSLNSFEDPNVRITPHDYDLFMDLAFLLKLKKIKSFTLIGVPQRGNKKMLLKEIIEKIEAISTQS
ncbi:hypothetical protein COY16_00095 [Candidatus Roizmanbacteria bacterium CG_4_10_14_0_2_um_filter_39_13]|uniref:Uncharacterized protein n=1 Tax=Candidatus Roizmanbacteria bacterium CG_4_10_14_0_2_um_filter_39_13 TaxID=1974825 RepID=A0A2M7U203_9BACT|nr:MAG: hypothetical protein COY16_00095 [Candidatus Roizmanbacteria bacterium CG_4_10_14_0_2_um_filter_39_13]